MKIGTLIRQKTFAPPSSNKKQWRYGLIAPEDTTVTSYVTADKYVTVMSFASLDCHFSRATRIR